MPDVPNTPPHHHEAHTHKDGTDHRAEQDCPGDEALPDDPIAAALGGEPNLPDYTGGGGSTKPPKPGTGG